MLISILRRCAAVFINGWGGAIVGALVGQCVGALLGPALGSMRLAEMLQKMVDEGALPLWAAWFFRFVFDWMPGASLARGIMGMLCGFLAGMGVGAVVGACVGLVVGVVTSLGLGGRPLVIPGVGRVKHSVLDHFLGQRLSSWFEGLALKHGVGIGLGLLAAEWIWNWSKDLPVNAAGPGYLVYATFGLVDAGLLGAAVGYLAASLCVILQRIAPWALAGTIPGVVWFKVAAVVRASALGASLVDTSFGSFLFEGRSSGALAILGAMMAHGLCLFVGPLRGKWSIAREGAFVALALGWLALDNPFAGGLGFFGFVVLGWAIPAWGPGLQLAAGTTGPVLLGPALPFWSFFWSGKALLGGLLGVFLGLFTGYLGGLPLWLLIGSALMHRGAIGRRWQWAKAQVDATAAVGAGVGAAAVSVGTAGVTSVTVAVATTSWFGACVGLLMVGLSLISGVSGAFGEGRGEFVTTVSAQQRTPGSADSAEPAADVTADLTADLTAAPQAAANDIRPTTPASATPTTAPPALSNAGGAEPGPSAVSSADPAVPLVASSQVRTPEARALEALLHRYYADLNGGDFDANRYFAPKVERFVSKLETTTSWITNYVRTTFPKQFREHHFGMVPGTLAPEGPPGQYTFVEHSRYLLVAKNKRFDARWRVRVRVDNAGKLIHFRQFEKAEPGQ